jgi:hypothetical protein|tara:strand:+ start:828 stop:953 length:126 start_codon:yes stop_codon:yes gene_type:complete
MKTPQVKPSWKWGIWNGKNVMINSDSKPDSVEVLKKEKKEG